MIHTMKFTTFSFVCLFVCISYDLSKWLVCENKGHSLVATYNFIRFLMGLFSLLIKLKPELYNTEQRVQIFQSWEVLTKNRCSLVWTTSFVGFGVISREARRWNLSDMVHCMCNCLKKMQHHWNLVRIWEKPYNAVGNVEICKFSVTWLELEFFCLFCINTFIRCTELSKTFLLFLKPFSYTHQLYKWFTCTYTLPLRLFFA